MADSVLGEHSEHRNRCDNDSQCGFHRRYRHKSNEGLNVRVRNGGQRGRLGDRGDAGKYTRAHGDQDTQLFLVH